MSSRESRPSKRENFFNRAKVVAERSTCLRRKVGAIIVNKDGVELSSGYSGAPRKLRHCIDMRSCLRMSLRIPPGERYELCRAVHAEQNAIINAARTGSSILGGEMYISSERMKNAYGNQSYQEKIYGPCIICKKEIINAGISMVHMREERVGEMSYSLNRIRQLLAQEEKNLWCKHREAHSQKKRRNG